MGLFVWLTVWRPDECDVWQVGTVKSFRENEGVEVSAQVCMVEKAKNFHSCIFSPPPFAVNNVPWLSCTHIVVTIAMLTRSRNRHQHYWSGRDQRSPNRMTFQTSAVTMRVVSVLKYKYRLKNQYLSGVYLIYKYLHSSLKCLHLLNCGNVR